MFQIALFFGVACFHKNHHPSFHRIFWGALFVFIFLVYFVNMCSLVSFILLSASRQFISVISALAQAFLMSFLAAEISYFKIRMESRHFVFLKQLAKAPLLMTTFSSIIHLSKIMARFGWLYSNDRISECNSPSQFVLNKFNFSKCWCFWQVS